MAKDKLSLIILSLEAKFNRMPTEDEVIDFINGDKETREKIWNEIPYK